MFSRIPDRFSRPGCGWQRQSMDFSEPSRDGIFIPVPYSLRIVENTRGFCYVYQRDPQRVDVGQVFGIRTCCRHVFSNTKCQITIVGPKSPYLVWRGQSFSYVFAHHLQFGLAVSSFGYCLLQNRDERRNGFFHNHLFLVVAEYGLTSWMVVLGVQHLL